ncbi:helix-turn-helix transcriptional regulator [Cytobacillus sp. FJAT-54145]|uniref:Helix-turn-helix transcriptional regulator n=1 Tax=Cytobacillus spartinae TaxID=3299023 RepID=A0ABW6K762_9BACI
MLSMLLIILNKGKVTGKELADHFEVSLRTIYRDIEKIGEAGIPIASFGGKGGGYYIMDEYRVNNLFLNKSEANIFVEVMNNLDFLFGKNSHYNDILLKFENTTKQNSSFTENLHINMSHFSMEKELIKQLALMNQSMEESRLLIIQYVNRHMEDEERVVEPLQIEFYKGHWYLIGFCRLRSDYRRFKLVRIRDVRLGDFYHRKKLSKDDIEKLLIDRYDQQSTQITLKFTYRFGPHLSEFFSKDKITNVEEKYFLVRDSFPCNEGLMKFILGFGNDCEVIDPAELRNEMKAYVEQLYQKYRH